MSIVKVSCPSSWLENANPNFVGGLPMYTPYLSGIWDDYKFLVNDKSIDECDYWLVYGFLECAEKVTVKKKTVLLLSEEADIKIWNKDFIKQFDVVIGSQTNIDHENYIYGQYICGWIVQKTFDQLVQMTPYKKEKILSVIASDTKSIQGHKNRYSFVEQLNQHFGNKLDWFGRGHNFLEDKWDGLYPYKFSIAIENQVSENYWTEKIADCFLAYTIPIYFGCPNIDEYFPKGSYINIDIHNLNKSIAQIEEAINSDYYEVNFEAMIEARELVLKKYNVIPKLVEIFNTLRNCNYSNITVRLLPEEKFIPLNFYGKLKSSVKNTLVIIKKI